VALRATLDRLIQPQTLGKEAAKRQNAASRPSQAKERLESSGGWCGVFEHRCRLEHQT
jgi:hypothetical protein